MPRPRIAAAVPLSPRCCCAVLALLLLCHSCITAAAPLLRWCCCAALALLLPYRPHLAPAAGGALASLLLWRSRHRCCCGALASLLPCRSHLAAAVALLYSSCCGALALLLLWRSQTSQLVSLLLLLPWRSRVTATVPLSLGCCVLCTALLYRFVLFCFVCLTTLGRASVGVRYHCGTVLDVGLQGYG